MTPLGPNDDVDYLEVDFFLDEGIHSLDDDDDDIFVSFLENNEIEKSYFEL